LYRRRSEYDGRQARRENGETAQQTGKDAQMLHASKCRHDGGLQVTLQSI